jgi:hypothetical protein
MKAATIVQPARGLLVLVFLATLAWLPQQALAQDLEYGESPGPFSRQELTQLLAPIALYPDALLSQILMAATYPIEVVEADRWVKGHPYLKGDELDAALLDRDWDPSVKAMCHFPTILALMGENTAVTTNLGNAFLAQEDEVMDVVQELREKAYEEGNLATTDKQRVIVENQTIIIQPANPRVVYVPYYDPVYVYGPWWYPAYPPYYWGPPGVHIGVRIAYWPGISFGFAFGDWSYLDWHSRIIFIRVHRRPRFVRHDHWVHKSGRWHHSRRHRHGVAYPDGHTAREYGQRSWRSRDFGRDLRGYPKPRVRPGTKGVVIKPQTRPDRRTKRRITVQPGTKGVDIKPLTRPDGRSKRRITVQPGTKGVDIQPGTRPPDRKPSGGTVRVPRHTDRQGSDSGGRTERRRVPVDKGGRTQQRPDTRGTTGRTTRRVDRRSDNIFNRVDDGRQERRASKRGRESRRSPVGKVREGGRVTRGDKGRRDVRPQGGR